MNHQRKCCSFLLSLFTQRNYQASYPSYQQSFRYFKSSTMASVPDGLSSITEGKATILHEGNDVFYNKAQVVNRDISTAVLRWFAGIQDKQPAKKSRKRGATVGSSKLPENTPVKKGVKGISILEAMAASGLRAIRYAKEIPGVGQIVANDLEVDAVKAIQRNIDFNKVGEIVTGHHSDARLFMLQHPQTFSVVDIDPYGSPTELLDMAVQSVKDGGLMAVTATDMAVLCGNTAEACFTKYGCYSLHRDYNHEQALRILLACLATHAARHKRVIEPVLCMSIDFYIRVFVRVRVSAADSKRTASKLAYIWQSTGCDSWWLQPVGTCSDGQKFQVGRGPPMPQTCPISGGKFLMGGPIWSEPLFQSDVVRSIYDDIQANKRMFASHEKTCAMLRAVLEELPDVPLYYTLSSITRTLKCESPKMVTLCNALLNAGYRVSNTHCNPTGLKTDAPPEVMWDIMRCWARKVGTKPREQESYQAKILAVEPKLAADFSKARGQFSKARAANQPRFVQNPENWGPRRKHGRPMLEHEVAAGAAATSGDGQEKPQAAPESKAAAPAPSPADEARGMPRAELDSKGDESLPAHDVRPQPGTAPQEDAGTADLATEAEQTADLAMDAKPTQNPTAAEETPQETTQECGIAEQSAAKRARTS